MKMPFFVMLYNGEYTKFIPLAESEFRTRMFATAAEAKAAALETAAGYHFGYQVFREKTPRKK